MQTKVFETMKRKSATVQVMGSSALIAGEVVYIGENYVVLSTKKSCKQFIDADKIISCWLNEDLPVETAE